MGERRNYRVVEEWRSFGGKNSLFFSRPSTPHLIGGFVALPSSLSLFIVAMFTHNIVNTISSSNEGLSFIVILP